MKPRTQRISRKSSVQVRYLLIVVLAMLLPTLIVGFCLYNLVFQLLARQIAFPEAIMANLVPVINRINTLLIVALPVGMIFILWPAVILSHRFAGPIERLEQELDRVLAGDWAHRISVRQQDDWVGVANRINRLLEKVRI